MEKYIEELNQIYDKIPSFNCIKNCMDCCGPIFMSGLERYLIDVKPKFNGATNCPWRGKGRCRIYDKRPIICRLFGTTNKTELLCSFGKGPSLLLSREIGDRLIYKTFELSNKAGFDAGMYTSNQAIMDFFISPTRIPIHLKGYKFNDKI